MVTNGVRDLVSPNEQAAANKLQQAGSAPASAIQQKPTHTEAEPPPAQASTSKIEIPLESVVQQLNSFLEESGRSLSFSIDQGSGKTVVKVYNSGTDELIRQFPAEQALKLAEVLQEHNGEVSGLLFDAQA
ncbi:MAG: flagellar protein FlaG [Pseudomonadota bacterium]